MVLDSPEEHMCDDADIAVASDKKKAVDEHYVCFYEYKADIYKHLREKEVICEMNTIFYVKTHYFSRTFYL